MRRRSGEAQVLAAAALWGTTGPVEVLTGYTSVAVALGAARILTGGVVLLGWSRLRGRWQAGRLGAQAVGAAATGVFQAAYFLAVARSGAALPTAVVFGVAPVVTGWLGYVVDGHRLTRAWLAGTALAVSGCLLLLLPGHSGQRDVLGTTLSLIAGLCYAAYTVVARRMAVDGSDPLGSVGITLVGGALPLLPWLLLDGAALWSAGGLATVAWMGVATTAGAYMLFVKGLSTVSAATAGTLGLVEPLIAVALGTVVLHESLTVTAGVGCGLALAGLVVMAR